MSRSRGGEGAIPSEAEIRAAKSARAEAAAAGGVDAVRAREAYMRTTGLDTEVEAGVDVGTVSGREVDNKGKKVRTITRVRGEEDVQVEEVRCCAPRGSGRR